MTLIAAQLGLPAPGNCTVGMAAEDERAVIVMRGFDGQDVATYQRERRAHDRPPSVSPDLARGLERCDHVRVLATPVLYGQPRVLPPTLAWSYTTATRDRTAPRTGAPAAQQALIVANVTPPEYLQLPALSSRIDDSMSQTIKLSGPAATPTAVLAEMANASEIQFHTHALLDTGLSDASHLVLSPGSDGRYGLTAETIRGGNLRGRPIVVLAACHAAQGARYQHAAWSLPAAFISVGARAVFAAAASIPDQEAATFFARVLERTRKGTEPAIALREERMAALAAKPSTWIADVILFE
jgi:hypothetical protein